MTCHTMGPALCLALWPLVPQGGAFVVRLSRPYGGECNLTTCSFSTCTSDCFAWLPTTKDPTTAGEDGVTDEIWVRPVVMGSVCSPEVGMNDMESLWGGTWSIWPMLYEGDWVCMTRGVSLKSKLRSKDGEVSERWAGSENVCEVGEGISGWEDAWVVGRGISRLGTAWAICGGISGEGDACGGGGNSGARDACRGCSTLTMAMAGKSWARAWSSNIFWCFWICLISIFQGKLGSYTVKEIHCLKYSCNLLVLRTTYYKMRQYLLVTSNLQVNKYNYYI